MLSQMALHTTLRYTVGGLCIVFTAAAAVLHDVIEGVAYYSDVHTVICMAVTAATVINAEQMALHVTLRYKVFLASLLLELL